MTTEQEKKEARAAYFKKYYADNKERIILKSTKWGLANKEKQRGFILKRQYNISLDDYNNLLTLQGGKCAICGTDRTDCKRALSVDHCHTSGKVRGLLCDACNKGIGLFKDNIQFMENAINYLKREIINN